MAGNVETEESGEGYFASVSDLMVGVLFVFLLMLTVFALNFRDAEEVAAVTIEQYEQAKREAEQAKRQAEEARAEARRQEGIARSEAAKALEQKQIADQEAEKARVQTAIAVREAENARLKEEENRRLRALLEQAVARLEEDIESRQRRRLAMLHSLAESLDRRGVQVAIDLRSGILRLSGDLLFETGQASYRPEARETVQVLAEVLGEILPCHAASATVADCPDPLPILETVLVEGHTDRQPYRGVTASQSQAMNDELSTRRALAVFQTLRETQPALEGLRSGDRLPLLGVSGYGERRPLADAQGDALADYQRNRRIDLRFVLSSRTSEELDKLRDQIRGVLEASR